MGSFQIWFHLADKFDWIVQIHFLLSREIIIDFGKGMFAVFHEDPFLLLRNINEISIKFKMVVTQIELSNAMVLASCLSINSLGLD